MNEDMEEIELDLTYEDIKQLKKDKFSELVKRKIREKAFSDLMILKNKHSKLDSITYTELSQQQYLIESKVENWVAQNIFKFRTRMADVHENFKNSYTYKALCPLCQKEKDDQSHLLKCEKIQNACPELKVATNYLDIFSDDCFQISKTTKLLSKALKTRTELID